MRKVLFGVLAVVGLSFVLITGVGTISANNTPAIIADGGGGDPTGG